MEASSAEVIGVVIFCIGLGVVTLNLKEEFDEVRNWGILGLWG